MVVDCGGGTIDISSYARAGSEGQSYIETSPAECEVPASIGVEFCLSSISRSPPGVYFCSQTCFGIPDW